MEDWEFWSRQRFRKPIVSFCGVYILFLYTWQQTLFSLEWSILMLWTLQDFMTPLRIQRHCLTCYSGALFLSGWTPSIRSNLRYWTYLTPSLSNFPGLAQCTNFPQWLFPYLFRGCQSHLCHGWSLFYPAYFIIFAPPISEPWVDKEKSWTQQCSWPVNLNLEICFFSIWLCLTKIRHCKLPKGDLPLTFCFH